MYHKKKISKELKAAIIVTTALNEHFKLVGCDLYDKSFNVMEALLQCKDKEYKYNKELGKFLSYSVVALAKAKIDYTKLSNGKNWTTLIEITKEIKKNKLVSGFYHNPSTLASI